MTQTKRNYRATFILDNRGKEDSIDQIIEEVKKEIAAVQGELGPIEALGKKDFARVTDRKLTGAAYVQIDFAGAPTVPAQLRERLRLNSNVYRIHVAAR